MLFLPKILAFDELESTNDTLKQLSEKEDLPEGTVVVAKVQKAGRGQAQKKWESESGKNLLCTILLKPKVLDSFFTLNKMVALAVRETIECVVEKEVDVKIKWPNDILVNGKKIAGILIENKIKGKLLESSFVGIGLNVNQSNFSEFLRPAISIKTITQKEVQVEKVLTILLEQISSFYYLYKVDKQKIDSLYIKHLYLRNKLSEFVINNEKFSLTILGVDELGNLCLQDKQGAEYVLPHHEIAYLK